MSRLATSLRKNDNVLVITGKDRGKRGRVLKVLAGKDGKNRLIVEGVNMIKRHTKPNPGKNVKGGIVEREASLHASNVQLVCPECGAQTRVGYKNVMAVPRLEKIVVNMGLGEATANAKLIDTGADEVARITGQKPVTRRAKKSIAQFKVRKGQPIATMVTLRGERMWEFLDRLMNIALPRVRDFKGVSPRGFDGRGNYTLGLRDQLLFPEIDYM